MSSSNRKATEVTPGFTTHGGAPAVREAAQKELVRAVSACMLFEDTFYESGNSIANRIAELCKQVPIKVISDLAIRAREDLRLRHVPLWLCVHMLPKNGTVSERQLVGQTIARVIQRADEPAELIALYWKNAGGRKMLPRQLKNGIKQAILKFNDYQLAKYDKSKAVKLRDAIFLTHVKPNSQESAQRLARVVNKESFPLKYEDRPYHPVGDFSELESPDTWEVALSGGADKKETFTRLLNERKLGYLALLRNLRNMVDVGVDLKLVGDALIKGAANSMALPFRFIAAAKHAPKLEGPLGEALVVAASQLPKLPGKTLLVVDISGSMGGRLSGKSEMSRIDAANGLAMLMREQCEAPTIYATAGNDGTRKHATGEVPARHGFALADAIKSLNSSLGGGGIFLVQCMNYIASKETGPFDRVVVITDEQDCDIGVEASTAKQLGKHNYIINVGSYAPALPVIGAGWTRVNGFSERVVDWMLIEEN